MAWKLKFSLMELLQFCQEEWARNIRIQMCKANCDVCQKTCSCKYRPRTSKNACLFFFFFGLINLRLTIKHVAYCVPQLAKIPIIPFQFQVLPNTKCGKVWGKEFFLKALYTLHSRINKCYYCCYFYLIEMLATLNVKYVM